MDPTLFEGLFTEILAPLINGTLSKLSDGAKAQWKKVEDKRAAETYKAKLTKRYGTIQILGQPRPQKLGKVYTDVYLHERPTHSYAEEIDNLEEMFREANKRFGREERTDGLAFAKEHDRLFILGKPGAGKTTFLKYLTMQAAEGDIPLIPIFVSLNDFQHQKVELLDYLAEQFDVCDFPEAKPFIEQLLKKGKGLILFDGLDEVSKEDSQRSTITRQLRQFITKYDLNQFAITCRIAASDYQFQNFAYVEMADFTDRQVEAFVRKWFAESKPKIDGFLKELAGSGNEGIKEMTTSPLLLTLLCIQYDGSMALPPSRSEVYEEALEVLLKTWDGHRDINRGDLIVEDEDRYKALTFKRKMQLMSRLAYGTFKEGNLFIEQKLLEDKIVDYIGKIPRGPDPELVDGGVVLKAMESQHGLLVERATRIYSFSHLTLQEYFTAKYIVDFGKGGEALSALVGTEKIIDPRWREVFLFVAELLPNGDEFIIWMAETLREIANVGEFNSLVSWVEKRSIKNPLSSKQSISRSKFLSHANVSSNIASISNKGAELRILALAKIKALSNSLVADKFQYLNLSFRYVEGFKEGVILGFSKKLIEMLDEETIERMEGEGDFVDYVLLDFYVKNLGVAIAESQKLDWKGLSQSLEDLSKLEPNSSDDQWKAIIFTIDRIENEIILDGCERQDTFKTDEVGLYMWINANELLGECLTRVVLEEVSREEFEDEYLYRISPHARSNNQQRMKN